MCTYVHVCVCVGTVVCVCLCMCVCKFVGVTSPCFLTFNSAAATFSTTYSSQRDFIDRSEVIVESHDSLVMQEHFASLEDTSSAPREILSQEPAQIIRLP